MSGSQDMAYGIRVCYNPPHGIDTIADVVFVHGLTGTANNTWATKKVAYTGLRHFFARTSPTSGSLPSGTMPMSLLFGTRYPKTGLVTMRRTCLEVWYVSENVRIRSL